jgi:hypothetical protein
MYVVQVVIKITKSLKYNDNFGVILTDLQIEFKYQ